MSPAFTPPRSELLRLNKGQVLHRPAVAGLQVQVEQGELLLTEPPNAWLGPDGLRRWLCTGQGHVLGQAGWLRLEARSDCRLRWQPA